MATRVPSKNGSRAGQTVELAYSGKMTPSTILAERNRAGFHSVHETSSANRLYCGDNLAALRELCEDPSIRGQVTLVYIDPPFATRGTFLSRKQHKAYEDDLCGAEYVESIRHRLVLLRELISPSGSIYVHLDENMVFEIKLAMDEIFGASNYRNMIVRKKCNPKNYTRKAYGNVADFVLFYTKSDTYVWNRPMEPLSKQSAKEYQYVEPKTGRRFMKVPVHAPGKRNGATGGIWRGKLPPPGKHWQYTPETLDQMDARGEIFWSKNGNPRRKVYLDQHPGVGIQDIWLDFRDAHNQNVKITGYPTEKNPDLLRRIVRASSNPGDLVLDCYAGSGTTLAVADELQRHWIGVERSPEAVATILERFERGLRPMGDYVAKRNSASGSLAQPSLFDSLEEDVSETAVDSSDDHTPITDYSVYVEQNESAGLSGIVGDWLVRQGIAPHAEVRDATVASASNCLEDACNKLRRQDRNLARIIDAIGPCNLTPHGPKFDFLVDAIIGQQLSKQAADTITKRVREIFRASRPTPKSFIKTSKEEIIASGVSSRKYEYILDLARHVDSRRLRLSQLSEEDDESIRERLKQVKGIGDWTVDMFLLFGLGRMDVFPVHDLALRRAMSTVYAVDVDDETALRRVASRWRPFRSVGSWYLYRSANAQDDRSK